MADVSRIKEHVSEIERLKESARLTALDLMDTVDPEELLEDAEGYAAALTAALLLKVEPLISGAVEASIAYAQSLGLAEITPAEAETITAEALESFLDNEAEETSRRLESTAGTLLKSVAAGVGLGVILASLQSSAGRTALLAGAAAVFGNGAAGMIGNIERSVLDASADLTVTMNADVGQETFGSESTTWTFTWVTVGDGRECSDIVENSCDERNGMTLTLAEWDELGRPGAPNLLCSIYSRKGDSQCRCVLEPADRNGGSNLTRVDVSDAIKAGQDRAAGQ
jgi:hypothetical protein